MTVRRKTPDGHEELVKLPVLKMLLGQEGFRLALIIMVASMHPVGRGFLSGFGFKFQDEKKIEEAATEAKGNKTELQLLTESVKEIQSDITSIKANNAIINAKVDGLDQTFRGFQIDFNKFRPNPVVTPSQE
jgi:outer membrane murein-binding lipoprotein Lpp